MGSSHLGILLFMALFTWFACPDKKHRFIISRIIPLLLRSLCHKLHPRWLFENFEKGIEYYTICLNLTNAKIFPISRLGFQV